MNKWFYGLILAGAGLILCRDAATLAAASFPPDQVQVQPGVVYYRDR